MQAPVGFDGIIKTFGDIRTYIDATGVLSSQWNFDMLGTCNLPFPMVLAWNTAVTVNRITCHKYMAPVFDQVFTAILNAGLQSSVQYFGGCFAFRPQRSTTKLSTHSWGIAIDLNPETNQQGTDGDMDPKVVEIFKNAGFEWGGDWPLPRKDGMHFQFASGY